jgi:hypothetical protein
LRMHFTMATCGRHGDRAREAERDGARKPGGCVGYSPLGMSFDCARLVRARVFNKPHSLDLLKPSNVRSIDEAAACDTCHTHRQNPD